jgi:hypothetical protein
MDRHRSGALLGFSISTSMRKLPISSLILSPMLTPSSTATMPVASILLLYYGDDALVDPSKTMSTSARLSRSKLERRWAASSRHTKAALSRLRKQNNSPTPSTCIFKYAPQCRAAHEESIDEVSSGTHQHDLDRNAHRC